MNETHNDTPHKRPGFGIVGLALAGFLFLGPGGYLVESGWRITGYTLCVIGLLPLLYDIFTGQMALYWRMVSVALPAYVALTICKKLFG